MDFASLLKKEISSKKKLHTQAAEAANSKYVSRRALKQTEYLNKKQIESNKSKSKSSYEESKKRSREEESREYELKRQRHEARKARLEKDKLVAAQTESLPEASLSEDEIRNKLRELNEPIAVFAETHNDKILRLHKLLVAAKEQEAQKQAELKERTVDLELVDSKDIPHVSIQMSATIRVILSEWAGHIKKDGNPSQEALDVLSQTQSALDPLILRLRKQELDTDLYKKLFNLLKCIQEHNYRGASDAYIKMSIGNAAWPIGVTAVGIHARSARERITGYHTKEGVDTAHIMDGDETRKWLIALKRLLTFSEAHLTTKSFKTSTPSTEQPEENRE